MYLIRQKRNDSSVDLWRVGEGSDSYWTNDKSLATKYSKDNADSQIEAFKMFDKQSKFKAVLCE